MFSMSSRMSTTRSWNWSRESPIAAATSGKRSLGSFMAARAPIYIYPAPFRRDLSRGARAASGLHGGDELQLRVILYGGAHRPVIGEQHQRPPLDVQHRCGRAGPLEL